MQYYETMAACQKSGQSAYTTCVISELIFDMDINTRQVVFVECLPLTRKRVLLTHLYIMKKGSWIIVCLCDIDERDCVVLLQMMILRSQRNAAVLLYRLAACAPVVQSTAAHCIHTMAGLPITTTHMHEQSHLASFPVINTRARPLILADANSQGYLTYIMQPQRSSIAVILSSSFLLVYFVLFLAFSFLRITGGVNRRPFSAPAFSETHY